MRSFMRFCDTLYFILLKHIKVNFGVNILQCDPISACLITMGRFLYITLAICNNIKKGLKNTTKGMLLLGRIETSEWYFDKQKLTCGVDFDTRALIPEKGLTILFCAN